MKKRSIIKVLALLLAAAHLLIFAAACGKSSKVSPEELVLSMCRKEAGLPAGTLYSSDAPEGSSGYLPPTLLLSAYGIPVDFSGIEKAAIRLSERKHPCEFAVILCRDGRKAEDIALFFRSRLELLERNSATAALLCGMTYEEYIFYVSNATILISGRYVALIVSSDPSAAKRAFFGAF